MTGQTLELSPNHVIGQHEGDVIPSIEVRGAVSARELHVVSEPVEPGLGLATARRAGDGDVVTLPQVRGGQYGAQWVTVIRCSSS